MQDVERFCSLYDDILLFHGFDRKLGLANYTDWEKKHREKQWRDQCLAMLHNA